MKILIKQYLASLNERDELDVVLPDILSEVGLTVLSRPMRGTTQYGVDVVATGPHTKTGKETLFLLSIKSGNLTRSEWASGNQALRPSLEEILEVYIPSHIPKRYKDLPIVIAVCFGGDIQETVRPQIDGFFDINTVKGVIEFEEWNGDYIAALIASGLLRENIFPKAMQTSFRKAVALVDEPAVCVAHFDDLLHQLTENVPKNNEQRLRLMRQIYLATWTVFIWCRDAKNLEAAYQVSGLATLRMWHISNAHFGKTKLAKSIDETMSKMILLNRSIATAFVAAHVVPYCDAEDSLGYSVNSSSNVDVNLKLFDVLGRVALSGLWLTQFKANQPIGTNQKLQNALDVELQKCVDIIRKMIEKNKVFATPLRDDHAIEITLACLFLQHAGEFVFLSDWVKQTTLASIFAHRTNGPYPCIYRDYAELASHPKLTEGYKEEATTGSILYPTLGIWLALCQADDTFEVLSEFEVDDMKHCTWQLWLPDDISEQYLYINTQSHGSGVTHFKAADGPAALLEQVRKEVMVSNEFDELSAIKFGQWPIVLLACLTYRLPIPPHFWMMQLIPEVEASKTAPVEEGLDKE